MMAMLRDHGGAAEANARTLLQHDPVPAPRQGPDYVASMVAHLHKDGFTAWCSLVTPCVLGLPVFFLWTLGPRVTGRRSAATFSSSSPWWRIKRLLNRAAENWGESFPRMRAHWHDWQQALLREAGDHRKESADHKSMWVNRNVTRLLTEITMLERAFEK